jgi:hypothetical protein
LAIEIVGDGYNHISYAREKTFLTNWNRKTVEIFEKLIGIFENGYERGIYNKLY